MILDGHYLAVFLVGGRVHVVDNQCLHLGSPLDGGWVEDHELQCPWHGWRYDLRTGAQLTEAGEEPGLAVYEAWIDDGLVKVRVDD